MRNIKLTLAYDGTEFHGWQVQPGQPTIQGALSDVVRKLTEERIAVHAAGRTDAGVHALGQVAHFKTQSNLSTAEFQRAFNALLPPAIRVVGAEEVGPDFHARWQAVSKTYGYRIYRGRVVPPFLWRYVLHYPYPLDEPAMAEAARLFEGEHDFSAFAASSGSEEEDRDRSPVRRIFRSEVFCPEKSLTTEHTEHTENKRQAPASCASFASSTSSTSFASFETCSTQQLIYLVRGQSFLRYMVRKMVGTLIEVGKGRLVPEDIPRLFELRDRSRSGPTVPAHGLCLVSVEYPEPWR